MSTTIDSAVAEKVMGWPRIDPGLAKRPDCYVQAFVYGPDLARTPTSNDWRPTLNICTAWEVVERLDSLGLGVHITRVKGVGDGPQSWSVDVSEPNDLRYGNGNNPNVCVAICQAALAALAGAHP